MVDFPKLSIIIPSYNQGEYLAETILSIIEQSYPKLELIIIDGCSNDNSLDIIRRYEKYITFWVSEKDNGQSHAINKGIAKATGDYIAWMNADDLYCRDAFNYIFSIPDIATYDFIYGPVLIGKTLKQSSLISGAKNKNFSLFNLLHFFYSVEYIIPSQSVFIKRSFLEKHDLKSLKEDFNFCMDLEWYCRIALTHPTYLKYQQAVSFFRMNNHGKTGSPGNKIQAEAVQLLLNHQNNLSKSEKSRLFKALYYHRVLKGFHNKTIKGNFHVLLKLAFKTPFAMRDRRFLGMIKLALSKKVKDLPV